jgi:hypothetical protein
MLTSSKDLKNIPISISFLHEQEYKNICQAYRLIKNSNKTRRAISESKSDKTPDGKKITSYSPKECVK